LYLERSKPTLEEEEVILLGQIMQEIRRPDPLCVEFEKKTIDATTGEIHCKRAMFFITR